MADWMENYGGPASVGVILGLVVLLGFGGLTAAIWDGRLNGDDATELREEVRVQEGEIVGLEREIAYTKDENLAFKRKEAVANKLKSLKKVLAATTVRRDELKEAVAASQAEIAAIHQEQDDYREEYRAYERNRAIGEIYQTIELTNGKVLTDVKLRRMTPDKVSFATEFGSTSVTWDELPPEWKVRFQVGSGEVEAHRKALEEAKMARALIMEENRDVNIANLKLKEKKNRISTLARKIREMESDCRVAEERIAVLETEAQKYQRRVARASTQGAAKTHRNSAEKVRTQIRAMQSRLNEARRFISEMEREKKNLEG